jgi:hypothetical protein
MDVDRVMDMDVDRVMDMEADMDVNVSNYVKSVS